MIATTWVRKFNKYLSVPVFSLSGFSWLGASYIVGKFDFLATRKFSLLVLPTKPTGVNYCLVISWYDPTSGEKVRYKLWEDVGELLYEDLYDGQRINTTFFLEIWSVEGETTAVQESEILLDTSILVSPSSSCCSPADVEADSSYDICTDKWMDVTTYQWSGVDGDYWTFTECGEATFVDIPTADILVDGGGDLYTQGPYDTFQAYSDGAAADGLNRGWYWAGPWSVRVSEFQNAKAEELLNGTGYTVGAALIGLTGNDGFSGPWN